MPTVPRQCGGVPQEFHCPLPLGSLAVCSMRPTDQCPKASWQCAASVPLPGTQGTVCDKSSTAHCPKVPSPTPEQSGSVTQEVTAHCPKAMRHCVTGVPLPIAPGECGYVWHEYHCHTAPR